MNWLVRIFLIGLMLHFFLYNWFNYSLGITFQPIWAWKEIFILIFIGIAIYQIVASKYFKQFINSKVIFWMEVTFVVMVLLSLMINVFVQHIPVGQFVLAFKYDFLGYLIFFVFYHLGYYLDKTFVEKTSLFYARFIKVLLVLALVWYAIIVVKPGFFKLFGYDRNVHEGSLGDRPPVVYYTQMNHGYVRNQFVFERPITWGFFLSAFWPLFYVSFLRRKNFRNTWYRWILFGLNIILTFSRAAWIAWIAQLLILGLLEYRRNIKTYLAKVVLPIIIVVGLLAGALFNDIVMRYFSNSGHIKLMEAGFHMFMENPIFGKGAATAGPGSHQVCGSNPNITVCQEISQINTKLENPDLKGFNTENQYLQVLVEFGLIVFLMWLAIYIFMSIYGIWQYRIVSKTQLKDPFIWILISMSVGMIGLSIEGFMLHSFVDRMVVYPIMLIYGLVISIYVQHGVHDLDFEHKDNESSILKRNEKKRHSKK